MGIRNVARVRGLNCFSIPTFITMMTSSNGNIFRVIGLCEGNPPVNGGFPSQRPVTRSFDIFFDLCLNKRSSKQSKRGIYETSSRSLWRHCNTKNEHNVHNVTQSHTMINFKGVDFRAGLIQLRKMSRKILSQSLRHILNLHRYDVCILVIRGKWSEKT